jgi:D-serine deaminase-like pyridoxal phosphate-dependent protein
MSVNDTVLKTINKPTLLLDENQCKANIEQQVLKAKRLNLIFRPHFKTHQSAEIGEWYRELGVNKITVSSVLMAEYFANNGWDDILIAFPVNVLEIDAINRLAKKIKLHVLISEEHAIAQLVNKIDAPISVFVEIDTGQNRSGFKLEEIENIKYTIHKINHSKHLIFSGFVAHAGQSYQYQHAPEKVKVLQAKLNSDLMALKSTFQDAFISVGDTPTFSLSDSFGGMDEVRPGNAVFYDWMQHQIGACAKEQIAVKLACPIVAIYPEREEFVVYGGAIHFSKEYVLTKSKQRNYGQLATINAMEISDDVFVANLTQEHGVVKASKQFCQQIALGDLAIFYPIHSCLTVDLMPKYHTWSGTEIQKFRFF